MACRPPALAAASSSRSPLRPATSSTTRSAPASPPRSRSAVYPRALTLLANLKFRLIAGYSSGFEISRALETGDGGASVRFTVASSYGFTKRFQNPNIDPHQPGERRFRRASLDEARASSEYWRPFLTAEPFLYAALGLDSAFT